MARRNYYEGLSADYSKPDPVSEPLRSQLIDDGLRFAAMKEAALPAIDAHYPAEQIEQETQQPPAKAGGLKLRTESPDTGR